MNKLLEMIFMNKIAMRFWKWRYDRKVKNFDFDAWLMSDDEEEES